MRQRRSGCCAVKPSPSPTRSHRGRPPARPRDSRLTAWPPLAAARPMRNLAVKLSVASFESASAITRYDPAPLDGLGPCGLRPRVSPEGGARHGRLGRARRPAGRARRAPGDGHDRLAGARHVAPPARFAEVAAKRAPTPLRDAAGFAIRDFPLAGGLAAPCPAAPGPAARATGERAPKSARFRLAARSCRRTAGVGCRASG